MKHWTEGSVKEFLYSIASDFIEQLHAKMDEMALSQGQLAARLGVTEGRVSQILNKPSNLKLEKIIEYSRALGMKVAIVAYDDGDHQNLQGPVPAGIFNICWEQAKKPLNFREIPKAANELVVYLPQPKTVRHAENTSNFGDWIVGSYGQYADWGTSSNIYIDKAFRLGKEVEKVWQK